MIPVKIGFVLLSNSTNPIPSTRIAVLNLFPFFRAVNIEPVIVYEPEQGNETPDVESIFDNIIDENINIVYFQKVHGNSVTQLVDKLSENGVKTIYGVCDLVDAVMAQKTDATIVVTDYLKSLYPQAVQNKIYVVHDGIEHPEIMKDSYSNHIASKSTPLNAVLVTSAMLTQLPLLDSIPDWLTVTIVGRYPKSLYSRIKVYYWAFSSMQTAEERKKFIKFLLNRKVKRISWDPIDVYQQIKSADIGIVPIEHIPAHKHGTLPPSWKVKSENRLTLKMAVGLPVIASTIPSYEPVIKQGDNGYLANSQSEWIACLEALKEPVKRIKIGKSARDCAIEKYSMDEQARLFIEVLHSLI